MARMQSQEIAACLVTHLTKFARKICVFWLPAL